MNGFTKLPNSILDKMADLTPGEFKLICAFYRLIEGFQDSRESGRRRIGLRQLVEVTGMSRRSVMDAAENLERKGFVIQHGKQGAVGEWQLVQNLPWSTSANSAHVETTGANSAPVLVQSLPGSGANSAPVTSGLKKTLKEREKKEEAAAAAALPETDPEAGAVFTAYQENIGSLTAHISELIGASIDELTAAWVLAAIKLAAERNKRNWKYIEGILKSWQAQGHMDYPQAPAQANGNGEAAWRRVMEQRKAGEWSLPKDGPEIEAIRRSGGWPRYKQSLDRELPFLKREFLQEYYHGH